MKNPFKILFIFFISLFFSILVVETGIKALFVLFILALLVFNWRNPGKSLLAYIFLLPFLPSYLGWDFGAFGMFHGVRVLNIIFLLPLAFRYFLKGDYPPGSHKRLYVFDAAVILFLVLLSLTTFINSGFTAGKGMLYHYFIDYFLMYFVFTRFAVKKEDYLKINYVLVLSGLTLCCLGLVDYLFGKGFYTEISSNLFPQLILFDEYAKDFLRADVVRMQISFGQPLSLAMYIVLLHLLIVITYKASFSVLKKVVYALAFLTSFLCLIMAQARGPFIVDFFLIGFVLIFLKKAKKAFIYIGLLSGLLIIFLAFNSDFALKDMPVLGDVWHENINRTSNVDFRFELYKNTLSNIKHLSFIGENTVFLDSLERRFIEDTVIWYIQLLVINGLITFLFFISMIIKVFFDLIKSLKKQKELFIYAYFFMLASLMLCYLGISFVGQCRYYFWLVFSLCVSLIINFRSNGSKESFAGRCFFKRTI